MDFTREPIIESVITPKEGCKLVIRSSKGAGQEEFFVDAVEVVSFGGTFFLRSLEKPKAFLVPATDYEILEVRETRMVLKNVGMERSIKIGGGKEKEKVKPPVREIAKPKPEVQPKQEPEAATEQKKREKKRPFRRRRGRDREAGGEEGIVADQSHEMRDSRVEEMGKPVQTNPSILSTLLPPPPTLISETIERYRGNALFKDVFYKESDLSLEVEDAQEPISLQEPLEVEAPAQSFSSAFEEEHEFDFSEKETPVLEENTDQESNSFNSKA